MQNITNKDIQDFSVNFNKDSKNILSKNAISNNNINNILINRSIIQKRNNIFKKTIDIKVKNTNQKSSGRCWIFAYLNLIRIKMIDKYRLPEDFEMSQNYLFFWDKLEKSNYFLKNILETRNKDLDSRLVSHFLSEPISDGGQWSMLVNLTNKYGLIPKKCMNESYGSSHTDDLNFIINNKLRDYAYEIRNTKKKINLKDYLKNIYKILVIFLGEPPNKINWEYYSETKKGKKKYNLINDITPQNFYKKYIPLNADNMICLVNVPIKSRPFYNKFVLKMFGNVVGGLDTNYINIPINDMISIAKKSIDNNEPMWFGSDVDKFYDDETGLLDIDNFDYKNIFGFNILKGVDKGNRLHYGMSAITHAMLIKGYDIVNNKITKWLIENSWGDENELDGNLIMSNSWFKEFVYEIVVDKKFIPKNILKVLDKKPILLEPWDPLGVLLNSKKTCKRKNNKIKNKSKKK